MQEEMSAEQVAALLRGEYVPRSPAKRDPSTLNQLVIDGLPIPGPGCNPNNSHCHWSVKLRSVRDQREASHALAAYELRRKGLPPPNWKIATVEATFHKPGNKAKYADGTNLNASLKAAIDGLQDAGVIENDSGIILLPPHQLIGDAADERKVTLVITKVQ
jgi:hypothetical protein